jgi:putative tryptophan/tyrosine transport system substrate-binding protein
MNKRKLGSFVLCAMLFALCLPAEAQQPKKIYRIGYLSSGDRAYDYGRSEPFRSALRELGYVEGQNIVIEYRYAEGKPDRLPELATELVRLKVDLIVVAAGDDPILAAKNATKTIPIVMAGQGSDPVKAGFVESLARPGSNITGLTSLNTELSEKRLELLKESVPKLSRVAVLYDPAMPSAVREVKGVQTAALALKLTLQPWEVHDTEEFGRVFAAMGKQRADGIYVASAGPLMRANEKRIVGFVLKQRLPSMHGS